MLPRIVLRDGISPNYSVCQKKQRFYRCISSYVSEAVSVLSVPVLAVLHPTSPQDIMGGRPQAQARAATSWCPSCQSSERVRNGMKKSLPKTSVIPRAQSDSRDDTRAGNADVGQGSPSQTPHPQAVGPRIPTATACARRGKHTAFFEQPPLTLKIPLEERGTCLFFKHPQHRVKAVCWPYFL